MEVVVTKTCQAKIVKSKLPVRQLGIPSLMMSDGGYSSKKVFFGRSKAWKQDGIRITVKASDQSQPVESQKTKPHEPPNGGRRFYVGLPKDTVSEDNTVNHANAITAGLKAMKLLGVEGVELPVWWGIVEKDRMGKYDWSAYIALAKMIETVGLKLHFTLCFHASKQDSIPLPKWVDEVGKSRPNIFFTDRSGQQYKDCLSFATDDSPIFCGKTPIHVYHDFCASFKSCFMSFLGTTITGISIGLGPNGELRYPSRHRQPSSSDEVSADVGEFQCYDENMLGLLKQHAEATGNPSWGLGGPHDAPTYNEPPYASSFFKDGGSWESTYGDFFLSWYSNQLINHGEALLSIASATFGDVDNIAIFGKLPFLYNWYKARSHPSELTAGFYNTSNRDGYDAIAEMFAGNSCKMILPGMDMRDADLAHGFLSNPESMLAQVMASCKKHRVMISGENSSLSGGSRGLDQIKKSLLEHNEMDMFIYQRMGAYFFSPEHFPLFIEFARSLNQPELHLHAGEAAVNSSLPNAESNISMQAA